MGSRRSTGRPTARGSRIFQRPRAARATGNMIGTTARKRAVHSFMASSVAPTLSYDSILSPTVLTRHDLPLKRQASTGIPPVAIPAARYRLLGVARRAALGAARRRSAARADQRHVRRESPAGGNEPWATGRSRQRSDHRGRRTRGLLSRGARGIPRTSSTSAPFRCGTRSRGPGRRGGATAGKTGRGTKRERRNRNRRGQPWSPLPSPSLAA